MHTETDPSTGAVKTVWKYSYRLRCGHKQTRSFSRPRNFNGMEVMCRSCGGYSPMLVDAESVREFGPQEVAVPNTTTFKVENISARIARLTHCNPYTLKELRDIVAAFDDLGETTRLWVGSNYRLGIFVSTKPDNNDGRPA